MRSLLALVSMLTLFAGCSSPEDRLSEHQRLAAEYLEAERWEEAKIELWNVIQLEPENGQAHFDMARTLWELREFPESRWQYLETVRVDPANLEARRRRA